MVGNPMHVGRIGPNHPTRLVRGGLSPIICKASSVLREALLDRFAPLCVRLCARKDLQNYTDYHQNILYQAPQALSFQHFDM